MAQKGSPPGGGALSRVNGGELPSPAMGEAHTKWRLRGPAGPHGLAEGAGAADARTCQQVARKHARTFSLASRLLSRDKRRAAFAVYATCRLADDIVDTSGLTGAAAVASLRAFRQATFDALTQPADDPVLRELALAVHAFQLPTAPLHELFDALERDIRAAPFDDWTDLEQYCQGVAGSVGEMCCAIFGVRDGASTTEAVACARLLGVAMQLTNVLRDVGEDAARGRCYLPARELARFGLDRDALLRGEVPDRTAWRAFMTFQIDRAREFYRRGWLGIPLVETDAQRCAIACATGYATILDAIEAADFDTRTRRVAAPRSTLLGVLWHAWRGIMPAPAEIVTTGRV